MENKKIKIILLIILILLVSSVFYFYNIKSSPVNDANITLFSGSSYENTENTGEKTLEYRNQNGGFRLFYPESLKVKEYNEEEGTYTIVFEDGKEEKSFQVFFTPYLEDAITESRILKDIPNGDFTTPVEVVLKDGTHALVFFTGGTYLGELREVWFIHRGFLYEVTADKSLDLWLSGIMQTWEFLPEGPKPIF